MRTLYTRREDGSVEIRCVNGHFYVQSKEKEFQSLQKLLDDIVGPGHRAGRYFKVRVREFSYEPEHNPILELFGSKRNLGIDLTVYSKDVAKLFYAGFRREVIQEGWEPEDVLQEVYKGIITRNRSKSAYDPAKSTLGSYVHMVCRCIVSNYRRSMRRKTNRETPGITEMRDGGFCVVDVREARHITQTVGAGEGGITPQSVNKLLKFIALRHPQSEAKKIAVIVQETMTGSLKKDIMQQHGLSAHELKALTEIMQEDSLAWMKAGYP